MSFLFTEIAVSLFVAFVLGCILTWFWRGQQLKKRVAAVENETTQRYKLDIANLRADLDESRQSAVALQADNTLLKTQISTAAPEPATEDTEEREALEQALTDAQTRYSSLRSRWERERTQFAQLVINKNNRIAALERDGGAGEQAVIEDGTAEHSEDDNQSYSRQQLEAMLVDMRAKVAEQESELTSLRSQQPGDQNAAPAASAPLGSSLQQALLKRDTEISTLKAALSSQTGGSRLIDVERERADLLHRVSELNGLRASDAEHTASLQNEKSALQSRLDDLTEQHSALKAQYDDAKTQLDTAAANVKTTEELEAKCTRLTDDISTLQTLLDSTTAERDHAVAKLGSASPASNVLPLAGSAGGLVRSDKLALQSELGSVKTELQTARRDLEAREQQLRWAQSELDELRPVQHQLISLRSSLTELATQEKHSETDSPEAAELTSLRTRLAKLQADSKVNLERKEQYYQELLREKSAQIASLQRQTETES